MTAALEKNGFICTRARLIKVLLAVLGAVVFLEYFSGLLMDGGRTITFYSTNSSNHRNDKPIQWPKRTHGRHCFDDHASTDREAQAIIGVKNITINNKNESNKEFINIHNTTQRLLLFKNNEITIENNTKTFDNISSNLNVTITNSSQKTYRTVFNVSDAKNILNLTDAIQNLNESTPKPGCDVPCPMIPPNLEGAISANLTEISLKDLETTHIDVEEGGRFAPRNCKPHDRVAIVIPYRDRESHLAIFLNNLHPFLMKQQIDYQIFIIEQKGKTQFNRASLMNVGFVEALKQRPWDCFIFHDVDLIPLDDRNLYTCPQQPRHLSAAIDKFNFKLPYKTIFGGVSALTTEQFQTLNGFSNSFWGWGGEDDDMANRISFHNFHISRYPMSIARYTMLDHEKEKPNQERYKLLTKGKLHFNTDGLNSLQYTLVSTEMHRLYTQILVELHPPS